MNIPKIYRTTIDEINTSVWCRLAPSPIHGIGVFAIRNIPKGTDLRTGTGYVEKWFLPEEYWGKIRKEILYLCFDRTIMASYAPPYLYNPNADANMRAFMNHSDHPNSTGKVALRNIKKGEEVTESFQMHYHIRPQTLAYYRQQGIYLK